MGGTVRHLRVRNGFDCASIFSPGWWYRVPLSHFESSVGSAKSSTLEGKKEHSNRNQEPGTEICDCHELPRMISAPKTEMHMKLSGGTRGASKFGLVTLAKWSAKPLAVEIQMRTMSRF
jgi:hypothetical protein